MKAPTVNARRRRVALLLAEGLSLKEIARALKIRVDTAEADARAIGADPNNLDYLSAKRALCRLLDAYDALEREAREHLRLAMEKNKLDSANRWFESIRRITEDRGRVLAQMGVLNRATAEIPKEEAETSEERLSPRARKLIARIALAEKLGHRWQGEITFEDTTALAPLPETVPPEGGR